MRNIKMEDCCKEDDLGESAVLPISYKSKNCIKVLRKVKAGIFLIELSC